MTIIYRNNDPVSGRWVGIGTDLSAFQIDSNFFESISRIATLEANSSFTVSIAFITQDTPDTFTFHMTDHTLQGPFTIPIATFTDRGDWLPSTAYSVNDTFSINGTLYLTIFPSPGQTSFDAGANDGLGHNFYNAMITVPGSSLPTGGATGQSLQKSSGTNFAVTWGNKLPNGGSTGQLLTKNSNTNQDASWKNSNGVTAPLPSPGGSIGQVLATLDGTPNSTEWISVVFAPPPSPGGVAGQVLSTVDGSHTNTAWINPGGGGGGGGSIAGASDYTAFSPLLLDDVVAWDGGSFANKHALNLFRDIDATIHSLASSGTAPLDTTLGNCFQIAPSGAVTIDVATPDQGVELTLFIYNITGSSQTITFGTNFKTTGTLATGVVTGKAFVMKFACDGANAYEISRTAAL